MSPTTTIARRTKPVPAPAPKSTKAKRDAAEPVETVLPIGITTELHAMGYVATTVAKVAALALNEQLVLAETVHALKHDQNRLVPVAWIKATAPSVWTDDDKAVAFALLPNTEAVHAWHQLGDTPPKQRTATADLTDDDMILRRCVLVWKNIAPLMVGTHQTPWGKIAVSIVNGIHPHLQLPSGARLQSDRLAATIRRLLLSGHAAARQTPSPAAAPARPFSPGTPGEKVADRPDEGANPGAVPIASIDVVTNDRQNFDATELQQLADSIREVGILQPLAVRDSGNGRFELVAGERRLRAATLAGLNAVPVHVVTAADGKTTAVMRLEENLKRVDLNAIEKAEAVRRLQTDHRMKQKDIGKLLGCTQAQVSNMTRLLELPADWRDRIESGRIAPTLARELVTWAKRPQVLAIVGKDFDAVAAIPAADPLSVSDLRSMIDDAIRKCTRPMRKVDVQSWMTIKSTDRHFGKVSPADQQQLDCETIDSLGWDRERAWNVELWDQLNAPAVKSRKEKEAKDKAKATEINKDAKKKFADQLANVYKLQCVIASQFQNTIADALERCKDVGKILQVSLTFLLLSDDGTAAETIADGLSVYNPNCGPTLLAALCGTPKEIANTLRTAACNDVMESLALPILTAAAGVLGCDLMHRWQPTAAVLDTLTDAGLTACCKEFSLVTGSRAEMLSTLQADWQPGIVPPFLTEYLPTE